MQKTTAIASRGFVRKERREDMLIDKIDKVFRPSVIRQLVTIAEQNPHLVVKHISSLLPSERKEVLTNIISIDSATGKHLYELITMIGASRQPMAV